MRKEKLRIVNEVLRTICSQGYGAIYLVDEAGWLHINGRKQVHQFKELCTHSNATPRGCDDCGAYGCQI